MVGGLLGTSGTTKLGGDAMASGGADSGAAYGGTNIFEGVTIEAPNFGKDYSAIIVVGFALVGFALWKFAR